MKYIGNYFYKLIIGRLRSEIITISCDLAQICVMDFSEWRGDDIMIMNSCYGEADSRLNRLEYLLSCFKN